MFKANVALLIGSKQSLTGFDFLERFSSPSCPANALAKIIEILMKLLKFFSLLIEYIVHNVIM